MELKIGDPLHEPKEPRNSFVVRVETDGENLEWKDTEIGPFFENKDEAELASVLKLLEEMREASHEFECLPYNDPRRHKPFYFAKFVKNFPAWFVSSAPEYWDEYCAETGSTLSWSEFETLSRGIGNKSLWWPSVRDGDGDQHIYDVDVIYIDAEGIERVVEWSL
jgi:hypothetical protein